MNSENKLRIELFDYLLNAYWLRPESALFYTFVLEKAIKLGARKFKGKSLDFGCMDGLISYLLMQGEIDLSFDVFEEVVSDKDFFKKSNLKFDYYDNVSSDEKWNLPNPIKKFDYGVDWKDSHITKSKRLNVHKNLINWDLKTNLSKLVNDKIDEIWAPNIYWLNDLPILFRQFHRIMSFENTKIITLGPDKSLEKNMIYSIKGDFDKKWLQDLDRGRHENAQKNGKSLDEWNKLFKKEGFEIVKYEKFINVPTNILYEIGFRPMFVPFIEMRKQMLKIGKKQFLDFKNKWVQRMKILLHPILSEEFTSAYNNRYFWYMFELTKSK